MTKLTINTADTLNSLLPQTQCTRCGYNGCKPYAEAILNQNIPHNQCPPGGQKLIQKLSKLLNRPELTLNPDNGSEQPRKLAFIREDECIGCTKCIQACPVDAIVGAAKKMHTVIQSECVGCDLCIEPCPVDCIDLIPAPDHQQPDNLSEEDRLKQSHYQKNRYDARNKRLENLEKLNHKDKKSKQNLSLDAKKAAILAALKK